MSNIEEDIKVNNKYIYIKEVAQKVVNRYKEKYKGEKFLPEPSEQTCMAYEILNLLSERETDKKRIKELEEENKLLLSSKVGIDLSYDDYIPKQKVKDKIEELKERKHNLIYTQPLETIKRINAQIRILQELLENK